MQYGTAAGLVCPFCDRFYEWVELESRILQTEEDGMAWLWCCPTCGDVVRKDPFAYPPDMPADFRIAS